MKRQKRIYLKNWVENLLMSIVALSIMFVGMTIESIGNTLYNEILVGVLVVNGLIVMVLNRYGKQFNQ